MDIFANDPTNEQALQAVSHSFQILQPYLPSELSERILYLFSGAEIEAEDLQEAGRNLQNVLSEVICKSLNEWVNSCTYIAQADAEKIFPIWDELPNKNWLFYQGLFNFCMKASVSTPMQAFQHVLRIFEEQPGLLSGENVAHPGYIFQPSEQHTFEQCPICGGEGKPFYNALAYRMSDFTYPHLPSKLWMKCGSCGNLYTWKYPEALLKCSDAERTISPDPARALETVTGTNAASLAIWSGILNKLHTFTSGKKLLEVGVGQGELLAVALEMGYQPDAVEIVPEVAHKVADMLGIPVWCGDFLNYDSQVTHSGITMGDVIEHVTDPEKALRIAYRLLDDDGVLWISTPNYQSSFSRMMKFQDPMWLEPYHISYFSRSGLLNLAEKCGFSLQEYCVSQRYNGSMELIFTKHRL